VEERVGCARAETCRWGHEKTDVVQARFEAMIRGDESENRMRVTSLVLGVACG